MIKVGLAHGSKSDSVIGNVFAEDSDDEQLLSPCVHGHYLLIRE